MRYSLILNFLSCLSYVFVWIECYLFDWQGFWNLRMQVSFELEDCLDGDQYLIVLLSNRFLNFLIRMGSYYISLCLYSFCFFYLDGLWNHFTILCDQLVVCVITYLKNFNFIYQFHLFFPFYRNHFFLYGIFLLILENHLVVLQFIFKLLNENV